MIRRAVLPLVALLLAGLLSGSAPAVSAPPAASDSAVRLPEPGMDWDYQIGGARPVPPGVGVVVRDRAEAPAGEYAVCYVNGFQTQPNEKTFWNGKRSALVLIDRSGRRVVDGAWGEWLLDIRTAKKRKRLTAIVSTWVRGCAEQGYDAVEFDNLDSYARSKGLLRKRHTVAYARSLVKVTHAAGLAVAQKNTAEIAHRRNRIGFDFAIVEECAEWKECAAFADAFGDRAYVVEYEASRWAEACGMVGDRVSVILRDLMVTADGPHRAC